MSQPTITAKKPRVITLEPGTYHWCTCGRSKDQPFCDGSHEGTDFIPMAFDIAEQQSVALCQCQHTKTPPFCDGTHESL